MSLKRCTNGHLYNPKKHGQCPYCDESELDKGVKENKKETLAHELKHAYDHRIRPKDEDWAKLNEGNYEDRRSEELARNFATKAMKEYENY